jgi:tellurite resistance protein
MTDFFAEGLGAPRQNASGGDAIDWRRLVEQSRAPSREEWTVPEAFVAVLFAAATCDGDLAREEHEELLALTHRSRALKSLSPAQLNEINVTIVNRLRADSEGALADACAALPAEMRLSAFAHALDLVLADGALSAQEADLLNDLVTLMRLDPAEVERIAQVLVLKNAY